MDFEPYSELGAAMIKKRRNSIPRKAKNPDVDYTERKTRRRRFSETEILPTTIGPDILANLKPLTRLVDYESDQDTENTMPDEMDTERQEEDLSEEQLKKMEEMRLNQLEDPHANYILEGAQYRNEEVKDELERYTVKEQLWKTNGAVAFLARQQRTIKSSEANMMRLENLNANANNKKKIKMLGHNLPADVTSEEIVHFHFEILSLLGAPQKIMDTHMSAVYACLGNPDRPNNMTDEELKRAPAWLEMSTAENNNWLWNVGIRKMRSLVHIIPKFAHVAYEKVYTENENFMFKFTNYILAGMKFDLGKAPADRHPHLRNVKFVKLYGGCKQHILVILDTNFEVKIHYSKLLTNARTRDFIETHNKQLVHQPVDVTEKPVYEIGTEVDYNKEMRRFGIDIDEYEGEQLIRKIPEFIPASKKMKLSMPRTRASGRGRGGRFMAFNLHNRYTKYTDEEQKFSDANTYPLGSRGKARGNGSSSVRNGQDKEERTFPSRRQTNYGSYTNGGGERRQQSRGRETEGSNDEEFEDCEADVTRQPVVTSTQPKRKYPQNSPIPMPQTQLARRGEDGKYYDPEGYELVLAKNLPKRTMIEGRDRGRTGRDHSSGSRRGYRN